MGKGYINKMKKYYKIFDIGKNGPKTLFHGINGTRELKLNKWLTAKMPIVNDNAQSYRAGFHLLKTLKETKAYFDKFKNKRNRCIIEVHVDENAGLWKKKTSKNVLLAKRIKITSKQWSNKLIKGK